jgi:hypothetical protein
LFTFSYLLNISLVRDGLTTLRASIKCFMPCGSDCVKRFSKQAMVLFYATESTYHFL